LKKQAFEEKTVCDLPQESNLLVHAKETRLICINDVWQYTFLVVCQSFGEGFIANCRKRYELIKNIQTTRQPSHGSEVYMMSIIFFFFLQRIQEFGSSQSLAIMPKDFIDF